MERIVTGTARWYLKCRACRKPWAIELPWLRVREMSGYDLPEYVGGPRKPRYSLRDDMAGPCEAAWSVCPLCGAEASNLTPHAIMGRVQGRRLRLEDLAPVCDGRCTNARGPNCDCHCLGEHHGTARVVARSVDAGKVPA
jgi:hypothetical protein